MRKRLIQLMAAAAIALLIAVPAQAVDSIFCKGMTGTSDTVGYAYGAYVLIPGDNNAQVVVTSFSATSDQAVATGNAYVYDKENSLAITSGNASGAQELGFASGGGSLDASDWIVIQDASGATIYIESIASVTATTLAINGTFDGTIASSGWTVYEMEQIATIPVGNATASYESDVAVVAGTRNSPVFIRIGGASSCSINFASGHYR